MDKLFYMRDSRGNVGDNAMFWNIGGAGYGTNLGKLEVYSLKEAQTCHNNRPSDVPLLKSEVDRLSIAAVDCQYLPAESPATDAQLAYVIQIPGKWNGNDVKFIGRHGDTYNYERAGVFSLIEVDENFRDEALYSIYLKDDLDKIRRRTFQARNIDVKNMITGPGIKLIKPKRVRPTTGKTRGNCPVCGKITWDYGSESNAYCAEHHYS